MRKIARTAGVLVLSAVAAAGCVHRVTESELLPGADIDADPAVTAPDLEVAAADGAVLRGYAFKTPGNRLAVVYFGGNGEIISPTSRIGELARRHGFDAYAVNYRGFGPSDGTAGLDAIQADSLRVFDAVAGRDAVRDQRLVVYGTSLGTAAALAVATQRAVAGVILQSPPSSAAEVIPQMRRSLPWYARPFLRLRAAPAVAARKPQPIDMARQLTRPLLVMHGTHDRIVGFEFGRKLFDAAASAPKDFCAVDGADHNDLWVVGGDRPHACLEGFLRQLEPPRATALPASERRE